MTIMTNFMHHGMLSSYLPHKGSSFTLYPILCGSPIIFPHLPWPLFLVNSRHLSFIVPFPIPSNFSLLFLIKYVFGSLLHPCKTFLLHFLIQPWVFILLFSLFCLNSFSHSSLPPDPFEVQVKAGCELHSGKSPEGFFQVAFNGLDLLSFQNTTWVPSPGSGSLAQSVCHLLNHQYEGVTETVYNLIRSTCPRFLLGLLDAGKMYVHRQGQ